MSKRVLIIGTSHSAGSCEGYHDDTDFLHYDERWHDYFKSEYGYEVVNLSMSGCTVQQQMIAVYAYFKDNPDARFDLAIVEGRSMESTVADPIHWYNGPPEVAFEDHPRNDVHNFNVYYRAWLDTADVRIANRRSGYSPMTSMQPTLSYPEQSRLMPWYLEYTFSMLHATEQWSVNLALCSYLTKFVNSVKWFAWSYSYNEVTELKMDIGKDMLKSYLFEDGWPEISPEMKEISKLSDVDCDCHHWNPKGHRLVWLAIEKRLKKEGIL